MLTVGVGSNCNIMPSGGSREWYLFYDLNLSCCCSSGKQPIPELGSDANGIRLHTAAQVVKSGGAFCVSDGGELCCPGESFSQSAVKYVLKWLMGH